MARDARRAQKAAAKRKKRQQKIRADRAVKRSNTSARTSRRRLLAAGSLPVDECVISKGWRERGLAHILLTRRAEDDTLVVGGYFVDIWCLGLKDCAALTGVTREEYEGRIKNEIFNDEVEFEPCDPPLARAVVEGAIAYADGLGLSPNKRWDEARQVFRGIEATTDPIEFGRGGKPCLVLRPGENLVGVRRKLERRLGEGGFTILEGGGDTP